MSCEDCTGCSKDAKMPIGPNMPRLLDPATIPNIGSSPNEVLHYRLAQVSRASTSILRPILSDSYSTIPLSSKLRGLTHQGKHGSPPEHTRPQLTCCSHPQQATYGVYMGKEKEADRGEDQTTGYSPPMCPQTKERAEVMAVNSAV
jgi:hypothetical protein